MTNEQVKVKTPEEILNKSLDKMTDDDVLTLAVEFELDRITPCDFWEMSKEARRAYAQRILDFFRISAKLLVEKLLLPEDVLTAQRYQNRIYELKVMSPRPWARIPKNRAEEFKLLELAFELWLNREPKRSPEPANKILSESEPSPEPVDTALSELFHLEHSFLWTENFPIRLINPEFGLERNAYTIAGNLDGFFTKKQMDDVTYFCPVKWISYEKLISLSPEIQKRYFATLSAFFKTTWTDILEHWFMDAVPVSEFTAHIHALDVHSGHIINSRNITEVIDKCANYEYGLGSEANLLEEFLDIPDIPEIPEIPAKEEIPPVAESDFTLLPTGEVVLDKPLEPEPKFGEIDTFYSLRVELPYEGYCEIEEILRKYRRAGAAKILQASYSDLDMMSIEA